MEPEFDAPAMLGVLLEHNVLFVVIGGMAATFHGSPFVTQDLDITPEASGENLERLSRALRDMDARIRTDAVPGGLPFDHSAESLAAAGIWNLTTRFGDLDLSFVPNGTTGYPDLVKDATDASVFGLVVPMASLSDVIRSKQAANRLKDQRVLPALREILASRYER